MQQSHLWWWSCIIRYFWTGKGVDDDQMKKLKEKKFSELTQILIYARSVVSECKFSAYMYIYFNVVISCCPLCLSLYSVRWPTRQRNKKGVTTIWTRTTTIYAHNTYYYALYAQTLFSITLNDSDMISLCSACIYIGKGVKCIGESSASSTVPNPAQHTFLTLLCLLHVWIHDLRPQTQIAVTVLSQKVYILSYKYIIELCMFIL